MKKGILLVNWLIITEVMIQAIKLEREWAEGTIRLTFGDDNTKEDVDYIIESLKEIIK